MLMRALANVLVLLTVLCLASCGGGGSAAPPPDDNTPVLFQFRMAGVGSSQDFRAYISDPAIKAQARAQLLLPTSQRTLHVVGNVARTNGGFNLNWNWHFIGSVGLVEVSIELCDTSPAQIEANLDYWTSSPPGGVCPWGAQVYAEIG